MRILVDGDSWAYTWDPGLNQLRRLPGFPELLQRSWTVTCSARGGDSNRRSVDRVLHAHRDYDLIIWIQTEPIRDWFISTADPEPKLDLDQLMPLVESQGSLSTVMTQHLRQHCYQPLNSIGKPVWLLGGCSKVAADQLKGFDNLTAVIPSISEFLLEDFADCLYQDTHQWASREYADRVMSLGNVDLISEWYAVTSDITRKLNRWGQDQQYFNPDKWHPNLLAHEQICDFLDHRLRGLSV